ncbi:right-handed parallel beta-helix repeat-containing protein [Halobacterium jilantaiense]|uniref:Right handed beta helix domain-containing protein n=1 Tax=Halobacterium jilantaiense TaxID=355548 RepID=A0A1I0MQG5_9EURY|nr:right-handed parallel beta-helix repeat-containing protein [Halobacterium jilantaiense]SEV90374.1 hypothetical protein SAMN04487945_0257 [Halobacterium jilantaiense]
MSEPNADDESRNDHPTDEKDASTTRRTFVKGLAAAATVGGSASLFGRASAQESLDGYLPPDGTQTIPAGEYDWDGDGLSVGSGDTLAGGGEAGDVVWNLNSDTMDGTVSGRLENVVVRGDNPAPKAGIDLAPGGVIDGFVWPEGGGQSEDRALYHPDGGSRTEVHNSAFGWMANNGAYIDKAPVTMENVAAVNNNIANIRVGHWERKGTSNPREKTTYIRNCLVAVTETPRHDDEAGSHARGIRLRHPAHLVIENCYVVFLDVDGTADLVELHDEAPGSTVEIRNTHFYNDSGGRIVRDKSGGEMDVTIEDCTIAGSGNREVQPSFDGNGFTEESVTVPLPSEITGYDAADEIDGIGPDVGPFSSDATGSGGTSESDSYDHTLVVHADPENPLSDDAAPGDLDMLVTVSGSADYGEDAEPDSDRVYTNADGTTTIKVNNLKPDEFDSFEFDGEVTDYVVDDGYGYTVSVDGKTTTFENLTDGTFDYNGSGTPDGSTDTSTGEDDSTSLPKSIVIDGQSATDVTTYTFTVTGDVNRDAENSTSSDDGLTWCAIEDVAEGGKVVGLVGDGVDVFQHSGDVTDLTVDGDAAVYMARND